MKYYLAITIGPIFSTLQQARKTRELWAASFLFSRLMEFLIQEVKNEPLKAEIILPMKPSQLDAGKRFGAGIFNDRLFASLPDKPETTAVENAINQAIRLLSVELCPEDGNVNEDYWRQALRVKWVCKPLENLNGGALFTKLGPLLDSAELAMPYFEKMAATDEMVRSLEKVYKTGMAKKVLPNAKGVYLELLKASNGLFPSTIDIATFELYQQSKPDYLKLLKPEDDMQPDEFYQSLSGESSIFKNKLCDYHKYYCIVHADGDNLSKLNATIHDDQGYQQLSKNLSNYAMVAAELINEYGGKPVFIGGDDLVFFAPVCSEYKGKQVSVFQLISALDEAYNEMNLTGSSLSFGITLTYYKYPLFEARDLSYAQLQEAKKGTKNAVVFKLLKHSGAFFEGRLDKSTLEAFVSAEKQMRKSEDDLISGIVYKMDTLSSLMNELHSTNDLEDRLEYLFENYFNEPIHRRNGDQLKSVQDFLLEIYKNSAEPGKNAYALLRLLKFVTDKPPKPKDKDKSTTSKAQTAI